MGGSLVCRKLLQGGELLLGGRATDLQPRDLAEPPMFACLGDPGI
ncbi:hypothetical protein AB0J68_16385 [Micromonospora sp. NPDC049580]